MYCLQFIFVYIYISNKTSLSQTSSQLVVADLSTWTEPRSDLSDMMCAMALAANKVREVMRQVGQACTLGD